MGVVHVASKISRRLRRKSSKLPWGQYSIITHTSRSRPEDKIFYQEWSHRNLTYGKLRSTTDLSNDKIPSVWSGLLFLHLPFVHAPSRLTMFLCSPMWIKIFSSDTKSLYSASDALSVEKAASQCSVKGLKGIQLHTWWLAIVHIRSSLYLIPALNSGFGRKLWLGVMPLLSAGMLPVTLA